MNLHFNFELAFVCPRGMHCCSEGYDGQVGVPRVGEWGVRDGVGMGGGSWRLEGYEDQCMLCEFLTRKSSIEAGIRRNAICYST